MDKISWTDYNVNLLNAAFLLFDVLSCSFEKAWGWSETSLLRNPWVGAILLYNLVKLLAAAFYEVDVFSWVSLGGVHKLERLNLLFSSEGIKYSKQE